VIHGESIVAAGCILPLSDDVTLERELGTRHRAALGLTEETDAICLVVSEETRKVSFASGGRLIWAVDSAFLRKNLLKALSRDGGA
jgi:diadenylate cyclase